MDFDGTGTLLTRYLNGLGMDERYANQPVSGAVQWYLTDNVGSVRQLAETDGTVDDAIHYDAFGTPHDSGAGDRFKFTGREWDAGTGQYYYRARYYGAGVGRFTTQDPTGFAAGDVNLYRYVGNYVTNAIDLSGQVEGDYWTSDIWGTLELVFGIDTFPAERSRDELVKKKQQELLNDPNKEMLPGGISKSAQCKLGAENSISRWHVDHGASGQQPTMPGSTNPPPPDWGLILLGPQEGGNGVAWDILIGLGGAAGSIGGGNSEPDIGGSDGPTYFPRDGNGNPLPLPRGPNGEAVPSSPYPHTQIGWNDGRNGSYIQTRQWGYDGLPVCDIDWTDHGRPNVHSDPHIHDWLPNPTGGSWIRVRGGRPPRRGEIW